MRRLRAMALVAAFAGAPAARARPPRCSIPDAEDWREYRSAHFVLATDVRRSTAADLVTNLERTRALLLQALFGEQVEIPGRVRVVAFGSPRQFEAVAPKDCDAYVVQSTDPPTIVMPFVGREPVPEVVAHELAHHLSWFAFPRQPRWFAEGIAGFFQTVAVERVGEAPELGTHVRRGTERAGGRWAGSAPGFMRAGVTGSGLLGAKELLEWRGGHDAAEPWRHHASSWLLYHWLWNKKSKQLTAFQLRLSEGQDPADAWHTSFPEYDPARPDSLAPLDAELARYRKSGRYVSYPVEAGEPDGRFTEAAITPADLHALLLRARWGWEEAPVEAKARSRAEIEEAVREDPAQPDAAYALACLDRRDAVPALRAAVAARPMDGRAWLLLGHALDASSNAAEKEAAYRKAVALSPESAEANNNLALLLASTGRASEARRFADRALDLAPWDRNVIDTLALVAMRIGQCKAAVQLERRAADLYGENEEAGAEIRKRLAEYEGKCGAEAPKARP